MSDVQLVFPCEAGKDKPWVLPPLGLGYLHATLEKAGISCGITDCTFSGLEKGIWEIIRAKPRVVGIYTMVTLGDNAKFMAGKLQGLVPNIVAGGPLASVYPDQFLDNFDYCVTGEGEASIVPFVETILQGRTAAGIPGVLGRSSGRAGPPGPITVADLSAIPHPERKLFPLDSYREYWLENFGYFPASIIATRGCPHHCDFCSRPISGNDFRIRDTEDILSEIQEIYGLGYRNLWFADDALSQDTRFLHRLSQGIRDLNTDLRWDCLSRTDNMEPRLIESLQKSGLRKVYLGLESGSEKTLRLMKKGTKVEDSIKTLKALKSCGILTHGFFMIGYPGETADDIWQTVAFSARSDLDEISYTVPYPLPGSALYARNMSYVNPRKEWTKDRENTVLVDCGLPEQFLKNMIDLANRAHEIALASGDREAARFLAARKADSEALPRTA